MKIFYVGEEHISETASPYEARRVVDLLRAEGWAAVYGGQPWQFDTAQERALFEGAFQWAVDVIAAELAGVKEVDLKELAKRRVQLNGRLQPHEAFLLAERLEWGGYWRWFLETPTDVILAWIEQDEKKDVFQG